jgi:hypothetical protein
VLNSDAAEFGGQGRPNLDRVYTTQPGSWGGRDHHFCVEVPSRVAFVLALVA